MPTVNMPEEERAQLKRFVRSVCDMVDSRFIQRGNKQDHSIKVWREDEGWRTTAPQYDWEEFRSFLTMFRQVAVTKDEPIYLPKIRNIISRYGDDSLRIELKQMKDHIQPILDGKASSIRVGKNTPEGEISYTGYDLLDAIINGWVFHGDPEHANAVDMARSSPEWHTIWIMRTEVIIPVLRACTWLLAVLREKKFLDDVDFPAPNPAVV
jgi:hypothetical protein